MRASLERRGRRDQAGGGLGGRLIVWQQLRPCCATEGATISRSSTACGAGAPCSIACTDVGIHDNALPSSNVPTIEKALAPTSTGSASGGSAMKKMARHAGGGQVIDGGSKYSVIAKIA
jgi:hypothetical protein